MLAQATAVYGAELPTTAPIYFAPLHPQLLQEVTRDAQELGLLDKQADDHPTAHCHPDRHRVPSPSNRGQPTIFDTGRHAFAFSVDCSGTPLNWNLDGNRVQARSDSPACP